ncbi:MAG: hypothetical protein RR140_03015 [Clostridia bacterium]
MTKYYKICSVFGHSKIKITYELKEKLKSCLINLIENKQVKIFYFGGLGEFDDLCWRIVTKLKVIYPDLKRIYCLSDPRHQRICKRPGWLKNEDYEEFVYLNLKFDWWYQRIYFRNCKIIDQSDYVVFYVKNTENSGAYKAMQYAKNNKKMFINLAQFP